VLDRDGEGRDHSALLSCDVVHIARFHGATTQRLAQTLKQRGVAVVWDGDDDYTAVPEHARGRLRRGALREQQMLRDVARMVSAADLVTTTSEPLAELYRSLGAARTRVIPNYLPDAFGMVDARERAADGTVTVGWIASSEHQHDMEVLGLSETLARLLEARPELRVASVGIRFDLPSDRYRHLMMVQHRDLADHVAATFDIGLAPLDDIPFNRARSDVKVKEYAIAGVPWLASPIGPYRGLGEKQGGRLVPADGWYDAIDRLVVKEKERRKLAKRGLSWARTQLVSRNLAPWEAAMTEAVELARAGAR